jgi:predicted kinase
MHRRTLIGSFILLMGLFSALEATDIEVVASHQDIAVYEKVFQEHCRLLKHLQKENSPGIIAFSAVPGMGKTRIAKHLEMRLEAVRLSSDQMRTLLKNHQINPEKRDEATHQRELDHYLQYCLARLDAMHPNKLYVLDMSVDRTWGQIHALASQKEIPMFLIRVDVHREVVEKRLKEREGPQESAYLKYMDSWYRDYESLNKHHPADFTFDNNEELACDNITHLVEAISQKFKRTF